MDRLKSLNQQYQEACISYAQLKQLWQNTLQTAYTDERQRKLREYRLGMEELEQRLLSLANRYQTYLLEEMRDGSGPSRLPMAF